MLIVEQYLRIINTIVISNKFNIIKPQNNKQLKKYWVSWEARCIHVYVYCSNVGIQF